MNHQIWQSNGVEVLPQFLASLAIGLLIGLERECRTSSKAGLRTYALVALLSTLTAILSPASVSWALLSLLPISPAPPKTMIQHHHEPVLRSACLFFIGLTN